MNGGVVAAFIYVDDTIQTYILLGWSGLVIIMVLAEGIFCYYVGYENNYKNIKKNKVYPDKEEKT